MTTEYLKGPSNSYGRALGTLVSRQPVIYSPTSTADVNRARLPRVSDLKGMELAYREQYYTDDELASIVNGRLMFVYFGSLVLTLLISLIGTVMPVTLALYGAGALSVLFGMNAIVRRGMNTQRLFLVVAVPALLVVLSSFLAILMSHRFVGAIVLALITLFIYQFQGDRPFRFFRDWLHAAPRIRPETRRQPGRIATKPNMLLLTGILAIAVVVPIWSPTVAIAGVLGVSIFFAGNLLHPRQILRRIRVVFGEYLTYGAVSTDAPGVWMPSASLAFRSLNAWRLMLPLFLTLATSLHLFAPWDVLRWSIKETYEEGTLAIVLGSPFEWVFLAMAAMGEGSVLWLWLFPVAIALSVVTPLLVFAAIYRVPLAAASELKGRINGTGADAIDFDPSRCEWDWYRDRMVMSTHAAPDPLNPKQQIREAEHLFLGIEPHAQFPVLLDKEAISEHVYITGDTGSGKTALGIMPLLIQLLRGNAAPDSTVDSPKLTEPPPIVILDLKGDPTLFHTVREESRKRREAAGITDDSDPRYAFRFFTPSPHQSSHVFNPFDSMKSDSRTDMQLCNLLLDSLSLNHGEGYGRSYYSRRSRMLLQQALTHEDAHSARPTSISELNEKLKRFMLKQGHVEGIDAEFGSPHDTFELLATIRTLADYPRLANSTQDVDPKHCIFMPDVLEERQVAYFWLPAALESISVREIAKLALYSALTAAIDRKSKPDQEDRQAFLVIDEFQRIAGENFKIILEQARSFGISAILANQTQQDLKTPDVDLRPTIRSNTRTKMFFSVTDPVEERELSDASGQEIAEFMSMTVAGSGGGTGTTSWQQSLKPRLTRNDIMSAADHPHDLILKVSRGAGYTQFAGMPFVVRTTYAMTEEDYKRRRREPWPTDGAPAPEEGPSLQEREKQAHADVAQVAARAIQGLRPDAET
ncbi:MAG: type IV secretion system DNA-binding domain-containing protein [Phycisphaerales bacterium]